MTDVTVAATRPPDRGAASGAAVHPSTCWECSVCCGSLVTVENGRVTDIVPNRDQPHSKGAFCIKGIRGALGVTYGPGRLLHPMRRAGPRGSGNWTRISWEAALDEMADRLAAVRTQYGPLALAGAVSGAFFSRGAIVALLLRSLGSPNWMINQDLCGGCRAVSARAMGLNITSGEDIAHTNCILLVGRNPSAADPVQWAAIKAAKKRGARLIVIDPKRIPACDLADIWLRPRPGTDAAVALAMIDVMIEEGLYDRDFVERWCHGFEALKERAARYSPGRAAELTGMPAGQIVAAARLYAQGPSCFVSGHGIDAFSAGVQTFRAFHSLVAIAGNVDRLGGNRRVKTPRGFRSYLDLLHMPQFRLPEEIERKTLGADRFPLWAGPRGWQTACHNPTVLDAILTGRPYPMRALYASGVNILVTYPNTQRTIEALRSLDFFAVAAHEMTPTAQMADIVLPKTTALEEEEVSFAPAGPIVLYTRNAAPPHGEARCDLDIAVGLLDRLEARGALTRRFIPWRDQREFNEFILGDSGISLAELQRKGFAEVAYRLGNFDEQPFATPSRKVELFSETLRAAGLDPLPDYVPPAREAAADDVRARYPLILLTGDREKTYHHSRFRGQSWAEKVSPDPILLIHPDTARALGIDGGDWVTVETPAQLPPCRLRAKLSDATAPDVVSTGMGWWRPDAPGPQHGALDVNINAAMAYDGPFDPASGSPDARGLLCRVEAVRTG
ncbi:MAG TPA: molybdopterin-dependent oxidoreductase [Xanthobacteraceae bacterium]|nr:molybdopterin-dependent oxidoreductase [Xanthobacteraceae bacterium]